MVAGRELSGVEWSGGGEGREVGLRFPREGCR